MRRPMEVLRGLGLAAAVFGAAHKAEASEPKAPADVASAQIVKRVEPAFHPLTSEQLISSVTGDELERTRANAENIPGFNENVQGKGRVSDMKPDGNIQVEIALAKDLALKLAAKTDEKDRGGGVMAKLKF